MEFLSDNGRNVAQITPSLRELVVHRKRGSTLPPLTVPGSVSLAAVTNSGRMVALALRSPSLLYVYRWDSGLRRWEFETQNLLPFAVTGIRWNEGAMVPEVVLTYVNGTASRYWMWADTWQHRPEGQ